MLSHVVCRTASSAPRTMAGAGVRNGAAGATRPSATKGARDHGEALEEALEQLGAFGLYHKYVLVMLCIPNLFAAMYSLNYVFVADQVPFRWESLFCSEGIYFSDMDCFVEYVPVVQVLTTNLVLVVINANSRVKSPFCHTQDLISLQHV